MLSELFKTEPINDFIKVVYSKKERNESPEFTKYKVNEAKTWLKQILAMQSKIKTMKDEIKALRSQIGISGVHYSDIPKNPNSSDDAILNTILLLEEQCENLNMYIEEYRKRLKQSEAILQSLNSHEYAYEIIKRHYLKGQSYLYIAMSLNYSDETVKKISKKALLEIYDKLPYYYKTQLPKAI